MPKVAQEYVVLKTKDQKKARELIAFEVVRLPVFSELDGKRVPIPKEAIFRKEGLVHYETLSPDYALITHAEAFDAMLVALQGFVVELERITLERHGAEMTACFRFIGQAIGPNDEAICPELTLVNSYNCATSLGLKLGSFHTRYRMSALVPDSPSARWMHFGNKIDPVIIRESIVECMGHFNQKVIPFYNEMGTWPTSIRGIEKALPKKLAKSFKEAHADRILHNEWHAFNYALSLINKCEATPSHRLHLLKKIADWIE